MFQMLEETSIFTGPDKVLRHENCQIDVLCANMNTDVSPYMLKFQTLLKKILALQWLLRFMVVYSSQKVK